MSKTYKDDYAISEELRRNSLSALEKVFSEYQLDGVFIDERLLYMPDDEFLAIMDWWIMVIEKGEEFAENPTEENFERMLADIIRREAYEEIVAFDLKVPGYGLKAYQRCKDRIPANKVWEIITTIYYRAGYDFPVEEILEAKKYRMDDPCVSLPMDFSDTDELTVYRTSTTAPDYPQKVCSELSWTTSSSVARHFYEMRLQRDEPHFAYVANIKKKDILACNGFSRKGEKEIMQYQGIYNLRNLSKAELDAICTIEELQDRETPKYWM